MRITLVQELEGRVLQIDELEATGRFGNEMLKYNAVRGILGAELHYVDQEQRCLYQVKDRISLSEYLRRGSIHKMQLADLLEQLIQILSCCQEYFLDEKNLLLQCDFMFWDERERQLWIPYVEGYNKNINKGISKFLENCMDTMNHQDKELTFFVYGLHGLSKDSHFDLNKLSDFLAENRKKPACPKSESKREKDTPPPVGEDAPSVFTQPKEISGQKPEQSWGKWLVFAAAAVVLIVVLYQAGVLQDPLSGEVDVRRGAILLILLLAAAYGYNKKEPGQRRSEGMMGKYKNKSEEATVQLVGTGSDETVVLEQAEEKNGRINLIPQDWHREEIKIRKSPFFIGKDAAKADGIIGEGEVSRLHVKVVADAQGVFLIDQESTNGTFVNGRRLVPWQRCSLKDGDMIGISSIYYKVELYS